MTKPIKFIFNNYYSKVNESDIRKIKLNYTVLI